MNVFNMFLEEIKIYHLLLYCTARLLNLTHTRSLAAVHIEQGKGLAQVNTTKFIFTSSQSFAERTKNVNHQVIYI